MIYDFGYRKIDFKLTEQDTLHSLDHRTKMQEWSGPLGPMNALNGVDWDKVQRGFPFYSFRCRDCNYHGDDYNQYGEKRE